MKKLLMMSVAGSALLAASGMAQAEIVIAVAGPMTGQYASFGAQMQNGAEMAVADINAAGGVLGEDVVLEIGDDACDARQAVSVANQMVSAGAVFVAGHWCSGSSIPASYVYDEEGIVMISPGSTNPAFTEERPGPGIYRVCGRDDQQGAIAGAFLMENFPDAKVAFIHDNTAYGKGLADQTMKFYEEAGGEPLLYQAYTAGEQDYTALVTRLNEAGADIVYVGGYHTEAGLIRRQMSSMGMDDVIMMSGDALVSDEYWSITGETGEGTLMTFSPDPRKNEAASEVVEKFEAEGIDPEGYTLYTYAAIQAWAQAAEEAGATDFDAVVEALDAGTFQTVLGELNFDDKGDVELPGYVVYEWSNGEYDYLETADASGSDMGADSGSDAGSDAGGEMMQEEEGEGSAN